MLKTALWVSSEESLDNCFEAARKTRNELSNRSNTTPQAVRFRLLEVLFWLASAEDLDRTASNLLDIFRQVRLPDPDATDGVDPFELDVPPSKQISNLWGLRLDSAEVRGAASSLHQLFDLTLNTVELGYHPIEPDPVRFVVGEFHEDFEIDQEPRRFPVELQHRSAAITVHSGQCQSIHEDVVWVDDTSGRMGVVGGEPLPVLGQPEGNEPALRLTTDGEQMLQPFHRIDVRDDRVNRVD